MTDKETLLKSLRSDLRVSDEVSKLIVNKYATDDVLNRVKFVLSSRRAGVHYVDVGQYIINTLEVMRRLVKPKAKVAPKPLVKPKTPSYVPRHSASQNGIAPWRVVAKSQPEIAAKHLERMRDFLKGDK